MSAKREVLYYRVQPVMSRLPEDGFTMETAALATCMATGEMLSGSGGGGLFLKKDIVDALNMQQGDGKPKVILNAEDYDAMLLALEDGGNTALLARLRAKDDANQP